MVKTILNVSDHQHTNWRQTMKVNCFDRPGLDVSQSFFKDTERT